MTSSAIASTPDGMVRPRVRAVFDGRNILIDYQFAAADVDRTHTLAKELEHDPEKWAPVFPRDKREAFARRSCSNRKIERDGDSKKSRPALVANQPDLIVGHTTPVVAA